VIVAAAAPAGALAAGNVEGSFKHTDLSFLQKPVFLLIMVLGVVLLGVFERRFAGRTEEPRWLTYGLAAASLALGALFFGAELARRHDPVVIGIVAGVICAGLTVTVVLPAPPFGSALPGVPAVAVTGTVPLADDGIDVVIVTGGYAAPPASTSGPLPGRVQVTVWPDPVCEGRVHVHPVPLAAVTVCPAGTGNVAVTVPVVGPAPGAFDTVSW